MKPPRAGDSATLYRAFYRAFEDDPLPSRSAWGRFHDRLTGGATSYLATSPATAWREVTHRWRADKGVYRMVQVEIRLAQIVDLTKRSVQQRYGVDEEALTGNDYRLCQQLGNRLRAQGVQAIWTYSRADRPDGRQVVVLLDNLEQQSGIKVVNVSAID